MDTSVAGAQASTSLPQGRFVGQPGCHRLEGFSEEAASPCPGQCQPPRRYLFPRREKAACLSDTSHLPVCLCCSGCLWGSLKDVHARCPQLLVSRVNTVGCSPSGSVTCLTKCQQTFRSIDCTGLQSWVSEGWVSNSSSSRARDWNCLLERSTIKSSLPGDLGEQFEARLLGRRSG